MALHVIGKLLTGMTVVVICASVVGVLADVTAEESSHHGLNKVRTTRDYNSRSSTNNKNGITETEERRVSHRLIGGHLTHRSGEPRRTTDERDLEDEAWDDGLLLSSAGNGKEKKGGRTEDDDEKKTLSQQVKEGKYGLIQNEIHPEKLKRPGIISYLGNPEVPRDNAKNLGGLDEEEIWLAENHVLVLRGGRFPEHGSDKEAAGHQNWPPIDDYNAPKRQVKIPARPKVPPPFPIQLAEGGPVQVVGANGSTANNDAAADYDYSNPYYSEGFLPGEGPLFSISPNGSISSDSGKNLTNGRNQKNGTNPLGFGPLGGVIGPFYPSLPPGTVFLPPPDNQTESDEEDQSIYYPPPYSFYYPQDNTTAVPPGPLVPGIILPPPPDFFSASEEKETSAPTKPKCVKQPSDASSPPPIIHPTYLPPRKLSTKPYKTRVSFTTTPPPNDSTRTVTGPSPTLRQTTRTKYRNTSSTSPRKSYHSTVSYVENTTAKPERPTTHTSENHHTAQSKIEDRVVEGGASGKSRWSAVVSSTAVPLLAYYATTPSSLEQPVEATPASVKSVVTDHPDQASYYFYEESSDELSGTTVNPPAYYRTTTPPPYYKVEPFTQAPQEQKQRKEYYSVEMVPSQQTAKDFNAKLINALVTESPSYQYSKSGTVLNPIGYDEGSTRVQGQRMLSDSAPVYYQSISVQSPPALKPQYYATPRAPYYYQDSQEPRYDYSQQTKPKPVYQYSYKVADYAKQREQQYYQQSTPQPEPISYNEFQEIQSNNEQYDYDGSETLPAQRLQPQRAPYESLQSGVNSPTTVPPVINTTPNPHHAYFTKQDEQLLDDVTKEYFTIFGKKLSGKGTPSTTPIYGNAISSTTENPNYDANTYVDNDYDNVHQSSLHNTPKVKVHYGDQTQKPFSLKDDTLVNYKNPLPPINPDAEFISVAQPPPNPQTAEQYRVIRPSNQRGPLTQGYSSQHFVQPANKSPGNFVPVTPPNAKAEVQEYRIQPVVRPADQRPGQILDYGTHRIVQQSSNQSPNSFLSNTREEDRRQYPPRPISLEDDIAVNYRNPRPPINPDAEFIAPVPQGGNRPNKASSYFAYQLPGNGGHFYFLTPQAVAQRQDENRGYLYPNPTRQRLLRRRRGPTANV